MLTDPGFRFGSAELWPLGLHEDSDEELNPENFLTSASPQTQNPNP